MSSFLLVGSLVTATGVLAAERVHSHFKVRQSEIRKQIQKLDAAHHVLNQHREAFDQFMDLDVPLSLKEMLLEFNRSISRQEAAESLVSNFIGHLENQSSGNIENQKSPDHDNLAVLDFRKLMEDQPDHAKLLKKAITTGLVGTFFRWPNAEKALDDALARLATNSEQEVTKIVRVAGRPARAFVDERHPVGAVPC